MRGARAVRFAGGNPPTRAPAPHPDRRQALATWHGSQKHGPAPCDGGGTGCGCWYSGTPRMGRSTAPLSGW
uniref:Uncharacterized protein n=1 Tax=Arundo donax TaxID=35708 RepID=A0A0A9HE66_ARUDO